DPTSISASGGDASLVSGQVAAVCATDPTPVGGGTPTAADGTVSFYDGTTLLGTKTLSGSPATATFITTALADGPHTITAAYSGELGRPSCRDTGDTATVAPAPTAISARA